MIINSEIFGSKGNYAQYSMPVEKTMSVPTRRIGVIDDILINISIKIGDLVRKLKCKNADNNEKERVRLYTK